MKTIINLILITVLSINISLAALPAYKINVSNLNQTSKNSLEFDIYLQSTGSDNEELRYSLGQYCLDFNSNIANGGKLTYTIISSDLPEAMRPKKPTVADNQLRLLVNSVNPDKSSLPVISNKSPGILVAKVRLETSADKFADLPLDLKMTDSKFKTKIFIYDGKKNIELLNSENNSIEDANSNSSVENISSLPVEFALTQNYPNPFNPTTKISYDLPTSNFVSLKIFDLVGKEIATLVNENKEAGRYTASFNGANLASGIYFYRLVVSSSNSLTAKGGGNDFVQVRKMVLVK
ncbi:MAG TPA: T9SS type A sorting domain-containing protein [Ignavibacteria bacterium]|nr:T9SS type A sorting domain-containing protein [Ignavibacteria bacterium]